MVGLLWGNQSYLFLIALSQPRPLRRAGLLRLDDRMKMVIVHNIEIVDQKDGLDPHMRIALRDVLEFPPSNEFGEGFTYETANEWDEGHDGSPAKKH